MTTGAYRRGVIRAVFGVERHQACHLPILGLTEQTLNPRLYTIQYTQHTDHPTLIPASPAASFKSHTTQCSEQHHSSWCSHPSTPHTYTHTHFSPETQESHKPLAPRRSNTAGCTPPSPGRVLRLGRRFRHWQPCWRTDAVA
jgi:hypothetical protein